MPDPIPMGESVLVSAVIAALLWLAAAWPWWQLSPLRMRLGWVLGLGAGFYAGCAVLGQWPRWPAPEDKDRFLVLVMPLTLLVEVVAALVNRPRWFAWLPRVGVAAVAAPILLYHSSYVTDLSGPGSAEWSATQAVLIFAGLAAALLIVWGLLALLSARTSERAAAPVLALVLLAAAVAVMLTGYLIGGQLALPLAGALSGATLASFAAPAPGDTSRYLGVGVVGLFTLLVMGHFFSYLPMWAAVCLMFVPLLAWLPELPSPLRRWPSMREAARLSLVVLPLLFIIPYAQKPKETPATPPSEFDVTPDDYKAFGK